MDVERDGNYANQEKLDNLRRKTNANVNTKIEKKKIRTHIVIREESN